jgi:hypothetical protein
MRDQQMQKDLPASTAVPSSSSLASGVTVKSRYLGRMLRCPVVDAVTVAAGLGSGLEGCHPLFRTRGTGGGRVDGCGRRSTRRRFSWRLLVMARVWGSEGLLPKGYGALLKGFMMPGTDMANVKGKNMAFVIVNNRGLWP